MLAAEDYGPTKVPTDHLQLKDEILKKFPKTTMFDCFFFKSSTLFFVNIQTFLSNMSNLCSICKIYC